jgi:mycoredoxin
VVTVFSIASCGYCRRLTDQLEREGIAHVKVDIEQDDEAARYVMSVNGGNRTVPTVRYPDGGSQTNPTIADVKARLGA